MWRGGTLGLWVGEGEGAGHETRWGIVTSRRQIPKAVTRNRWRRQIRAALREKKNQVQKGFQAVWWVKEAKRRLPHRELRDEMVGLLERAGLFLGKAE